MYNSISILWHFHDTLAQLERCNAVGANRVQVPMQTASPLDLDFTHESLRGNFFFGHGTHSVSAVAGDMNFYGLGNENARGRIGIPFKTRVDQYHSSTSFIFPYGHKLKLGLPSVPCALHCCERRVQEAVNC